jgi:hypothetical protein
MIKMIIEAENPRELHEFIVNLRDGYNDEVLDTILEKVSQPMPNIMADSEMVKMFSELYDFFKKRNKND